MYYRIVKTNPPPTDDYVSSYHQNQTRAERVVESGQRTKCETMGLSVYADQDEAFKCAGQYPKIGNMIARVTLTPVAGKLLETGSKFDSHHTWWKADGFNPIGYSQVVASL